MKHDEFIKKIKQKAKQDQKNRQDPRFLNVMGFLVAKGFLQVNFELPLLPNKRIHIEDAIWVGLNVEPRVLEVLPAAVLRLGKHFDFDVEKYPELAAVIQALRKQEESEITFLEIPFNKLKTWIHYPLKDNRMKSLTERKITKTFRLKPEVIAYLKQMAKEMHCSETEVLEKSLLKAKANS